MLSYVTVIVMRIGINEKDFSLGYIHVGLTLKERYESNSLSF